MYISAYYFHLPLLLFLFATLCPQHGPWWVQMAQMISPLIRLEQYLCRNSVKLWYVIKTVTFLHARFFISCLYFYLWISVYKCVIILFKKCDHSVGKLELPDPLWKPQWVLRLQAGLFALQIATWDLGLWLLSGTFTVSQLSISERWNFQPPEKEAVHMAIFPFPFHRVPDLATRSRLLGY